MRQTTFNTKQKLNKTKQDNYKNRRNKQSSTTERKKNERKKERKKEVINKDKN